MARNLRVGVQRGLRQSIGGGLGTGDIFTLSQASFDFARTGTKDSRITFTRASSATYVAADGLIKTTPVNKLKHSEDFSQNVWIRSNAPSVTTGQLAPDNTNTAAKIAFTDVSNWYIYQDAGSVVGQPYIAHVYLKGSANATLGLRKPGLSNATIGGSGTASISVTTEWQKFEAITTSADATVGRFLIDGRTSNGASVPTGFELFIWHPQVEDGTTATDYIRTSSTISGAPRFDHDSATGKSLGLLIEEARTNKISSDFSTSNSVNGGTLSEVTSITNPDGTTGTVKLTATATLNRHRVQVTSSAENTNIHTYSVFVKKGNHRYVGLAQGGSGNNIYCIFDLDTKTITNDGGKGTHSLVSSGFEEYANGWFRLHVVGTTTGSSLTAFLAETDSQNGLQNWTATGSEFMYVWGAQKEEGSFPTSYIPTSGSAVTRAADVAEITGTNFSDFYNQSEGTMFVEAGTSFNTAKFDIFEYSNGTVSNRYTVRYDASTNKIAFTGQAGVTSQQFVNLSSLANIKAAATQSLGFAVNGVLTGDAGVSTSGTKTQLAFGYRGSEGGNYINGHIKRLIYFPTRLPDATLKSITS